MNQVNKEKIKIGVWGVILGAILAMVIGFVWGGWVLGDSSLKMGEEMARNAVVERMAPICVAQFNQDPERDEKLKKFKGIEAWKRDQYVKDQGWATMPFESEPDSRIADRCSSLIIINSQ